MPILKKYSELAPWWIMKRYTQQELKTKGHCAEKPSPCIIMMHKKIGSIRKATLNTLKFPNTAINIQLNNSMTKVLWNPWTIILHINHKCRKVENQASESKNKSINWGSLRRCNQMFPKMEKPGRLLDKNEERSMPSRLRFSLMLCSNRISRQHMLNFQVGIRNSITK